MLGRLLMVMTVVVTLVPARLPAQLSPANAVFSMTASAGLYANRIASISPPRAYTEICFKGGVVLSEIKQAGTPTAGGTCLPGDAGFLMERHRQLTDDWAGARLACLLNGLRLPEVWEWRVGCARRVEFGLVDMLGSGVHEWSSNFAAAIGDEGVGAAVAGAGSTCNSGAAAGWVLREDEVLSRQPYRCVR